MGNDIFLSQLREELNNNQIIANLEGFSLQNNELLKKTIKEAQLKIRFGQSEYIKIPGRKFDLIISYYGSLSYTHILMRKWHLLKLAHALRENGILICGYNLYYTGQIIEDADTYGNPSIINHFLHNVHNPVTFDYYSTKYKPDFMIAQEIAQIRIKFHKLGFECHFTHINDVDKPNIDGPNYVIYVRRMTNDEIRSLYSLEKIKLRQIRLNILNEEIEKVRQRYIKEIN